MVVVKTFNWGRLSKMSFMQEEYDNKRQGLMPLSPGLCKTSFYSVGITPSCCNIPSASSLHWIERIMIDKTLGVNLINNV